MRALRGLVRGALGGLALGVAARVLMRVAAVGMGLEPEFDILSSGLIVALFVLSGAGAGLAAATGLPAVLAAVVVAASSVLLLLTGGGIGIGEATSTFDRGLSSLRELMVLAVAVVIGALTFSTPYVGWRLGRRVRDQQVLSSAA